ncbi:MAG: hypothetical protein OXN85_13035 [Gemmatimonadetes bacterium]|nr:hypothetical protein [Candidatus Palauibacter australiensis]
MDLGVGKNFIVSARDIQTRFAFAWRPAEEANDRERRVAIRIQELGFQRLETLPQHVRLGRIEGFSQPLQAPPFGGRKVDLDRLARPPRVTHPLDLTLGIMNRHHDS